MLKGSNFLPKILSYRVIFLLHFPFEHDIMINVDFCIEYLFAKYHKEVRPLANIKSAAKRAKIGQANNLKNRSAMAKVRTAIKNFEAAFNAQDAEKAKETLAIAIKTIDQAASKGLLHKNNAANKKSRIMKMYNTLQA